MDYLFFGNTPAELAGEQIGRHSTQITVDTYDHLVPGANREAVNGLDDLGKKTFENAPQAHPAHAAAISASPHPPATI